MLSILQLQRRATCGPYDPGAYLALCRALVESGKQDYAESIFRRWQHLDPDSATIAYHRCVLLQEAAPGRAPDEYLVDEFDAFADSFDQVLAGLDYRVPEQFGRLLAQRLERSAARQVIDLGCGTGLCGLVARPYAARLCGVDLSPGMLQRARERGLYDELVECELVAYLESCAQRFDLLLAGDSLVYFGELRPAFAAARRVSAPGALLLASVERGYDDAGYALSASGRFQHGRDCVEAALYDTGWAAEQVETMVLRLEYGMPVEGLAVVARSR